MGPLAVLLGLGLGLTTPTAQAGATELSAVTPTVSVTWKKQAGTLWVEAPPGTYLQAEGPVMGWWEVGPRRFELRSNGADLHDGLALDLPTTQRGLRGELTVPVCEDGGTACRLVDLSFMGSLKAKKGKRVVLKPWTPEAEPVATAAPHHDLDEAMSLAQASGRRVLIDFGAVWCPPCNRLAAEVLEDPEDAGLLEAFVVATVDVDRVESWPAKSRYEVGGYPTVILVDADGTELDRTVGYTSEAEFKAWLAATSTVKPLSTLPPAAEVTGGEAAAIAQRLGRLGQRERAGEYLKRAAETGAFKEPAAAVAYHEARVHVLPQAEDVIWLSEHGAPELMAWIYGALDAAAESPKARVALLNAVRGAMAGADPVTLSDLLYCVGRLTEGPASQAAYGASAQVLAASFTGEAALDRGHWTDLASKWRHAGEPARAEAVLRRAVAAYPREFTFHYALAGHQLAVGTSAVEEARTALEHAYGDNALRATDRLARALHADGRTPEALALVDRTLERAIRPREDLVVRTPRYLEALTKTRAELGGTDK